MKKHAGLLAFAFAAGVIGMTAESAAQTYSVETRGNIQYVEHDGVKLAGDLYRPKNLDKAPVVVAVHGGGWQVGSRAFYQYWGPFLAGNGIALFDQLSPDEAGREDLSGRGLRRQSRRDSCAPMPRSSASTPIASG